MSISERVAELGGVASRATLLASFTRLDVDLALTSGEVVADSRGRYALPVTDVGIRMAHELTGVMCLTSAALHRGWEVLHTPDKPHILVPKNRRVSEEQRARCHLHRADLHADDREGLVTSVDYTLTQCFRALPYPEGLAVGDSALRHGVPPAALSRVARSVRGRGAPQVRRIAAAASPEAANPFESGLRGIADQVPGLHVRPQQVIRGSHSTVRPDLVDERLGVVLEADSFEWHGGRASLTKDARRYNLLIVDGWIVLRFAWEDVMFDQEYVHRVLVAVVALVERGTQVPPTRARAA